MKYFVAVIALAAAFAACAQNSEIENFREAMRAGKEAWTIGRSAELATYKARAANDREEAARQQIIWLDKYKESGEAYQKAIVIAPNLKAKAAAFNGAANSIFSLPNRQEEGVTLMKQAYELQPENGQYVYTYTWMLANSGKAEECCQVAEKFLAGNDYRKPFAANVITDNYIAVLLRLKRFDDAKKINAELLKFFPQYDKSEMIVAAEKKASERK